MNGLYLLAIFAALTIGILSLVNYGYAGSLMRCAAILRAVGRTAERGWSLIIRALEKHAADSHKRHCERWMQEMAE